MIGGGFGSEHYLGGVGGDLFHLGDDLLEAAPVVGSMGRTGICWDNALAESFFASLKNELVYRITFFPTKTAARTAVAEYIEVFYNQQRIHSALGCKTPLERSPTNTSKTSTTPHNQSIITVRRTPPRPRWPCQSRRLPALVGFVAAFRT